MVFINIPPEFKSYSHKNPIPQKASCQSEKRRQPCRFDGHKTRWRSGAFAAQSEWLMTQESGCRS